MADLTTKKRPAGTSGTEGDAALVLATVTLAALSTIMLGVTMLELIERVPAIFALELVGAIGIFLVVLGWAAAQRLRSTPDKYRATPPVLQMSLRRRRAS